MATLFKAALLVCIVASEPNREISQCFTVSAPYTEEEWMVNSIYFRYLFRRYVFVRHGNKVEADLSPADLLEETRRSLPNLTTTRQQQLSEALETHWKLFSIPNEVAEFLKNHPRDAAGALKSIPPRYRTKGDEELWKSRIKVWKMYSYLGVGNCAKSKDYQALQIEGILNSLWCYWKRFEEVASPLPAERPHWDISTCMTIAPRPRAKALAILFRSLYWRYTTVLFDYAEVKLSWDDFSSVISEIAAHHLSTRESSIVVKLSWQMFYIPNELAEFLKAYSGTYEDALKSVPQRYRTRGDGNDWLSRIKAWMHYGPLGVESYTEGFQKLKSNGIRKYLWCMWQSYEQQSLPVAVLAKRPIDEPEETFTPAAKHPKTVETTVPSHADHPVRHRRSNLAAPLLVHAAMPIRRHTIVAEAPEIVAEVDPSWTPIVEANVYDEEAVRNAAETLLGMLYQSPT